MTTQTDSPDASTALQFSESSPEVLALAAGKTRLRVGQIFSEYRLRNGWTAKRKRPDSGWRDFAYWTISDENGIVLGGAHKRLERAIATVLQHGKIA